MIYIVEGTGTLTLNGDTSAFDVRSLAYFRGDEETRLSNTGATGRTALAFPAPPYPAVDLAPAATRHDPYTP